MAEELPMASHESRKSEGITLSSEASQKIDPTVSLRSEPVVDNAVRRPYRQTALFLLVVMLIGVFWRNVSPMFVTQQEVYSTLDETFSELKSLRAAQIDEESWNQFRQRSLTKLGLLVPKLEKDAEISDPASLSLLGVASNYLPSLLKQETRFSDELESKISRHLAVAQQSMLPGSTSAAPAEFWMLLLASLNVGLVIAAVWLVAKKLMFKSSHAP